MADTDFIQQQINELQNITSGLESRVSEAITRVDNNQLMLQKLIDSEQTRAAQHDRIERTVLSMRAEMPTVQSIDDILSTGLAIRAAKTLMVATGLVFTGFVAYLFELFKGPPS